MCVSSVTTKGTILSSGSVGDVRSHDDDDTLFSKLKKKKKPRCDHRPSADIKTRTYYKPGLLNL